MKLRKSLLRAACGALVGALVAGCATKDYDVILRHGMIYDGSGRPPFAGDVAITGDRIAAIGALDGKRGKLEIDAHGLAVAPGFINMLSHAEESLIEDGRGQSDIRQGVTLEVLGESSMGPLNQAMKAEMKDAQADIRYDVGWTRLGEYLDWLARRGIAPNVASFVSASNAREAVLGYENRSPSAAELDRMRALVDQGMDDGALGLTTALIYPPAVFSSTEELIELAKVASRRGGMYIAHMRSEGSRLLEAIDEELRIAREARIPVEIYHLKAAGRDNWGKLDPAIQKIEAARAEGLRVTADMYLYPAAATGLASCVPPWTKEGGFQALVKRLQDPAIRERVRREMNTPTDAWENLYLLAGPDGIRFAGFKYPKLRALQGKTITEAAKLRGASPEDTVMDLLVEDDAGTFALYFLMSEENIAREVKLPWVSFCSDAEASAAEGVFLASSTHPRAYGNFARLLGKYVRQERLIPLSEAIRRLTSFPAANLGLAGRGLLSPGAFADVVVFDSEHIEDHATYDKPLTYATGVSQVFVNGVQVLRDGAPTEARPGRIVRLRQSPR